MKKVDLENMCFFAMSSRQFFSDSIIIIPAHDSGETINRSCSGFCLLPWLVGAIKFEYLFACVMECREPDNDACRRRESERYFVGSRASDRGVDDENIY